MVNINVQGSTFNDNSSVIKNNFEAPTREIVYENVNFDEIEKHLKKSKKKYKKDPDALLAISTLEGHTKKHDLSSLKAAMQNFSAQFSAATLANIAGTYLCKLAKII